MKRDKALLALILIFIVFMVASIIFLTRKDDRINKTKESLTDRIQDLTSTSLENISKKVRKASAAGQFYPSDEIELRTQINNYLESAEIMEKEGKIRILIVPHAGLSFSGKTAGMGFKQIQGQNYSKVIILGINHQDPFKHAAVYPSGHWATPLGNVEIDEELASRIINGTDIIFDTNAHDNEHSLEMEVLFLQETLTDFKIVPIILGAPKLETSVRLAYKIAGVMDEDTLIVVSTDLSHYPNWQDANEADKKMIDAMLTGQIKSLDHASAWIYAKKYPNLSTAACGFQPLKVGIKVAEILNITDFAEIDYTNSGDISGNKERVVGYAAVGAWSTNLQLPAFDQETKEEALKLARNTLEEYYQTDLKMYYESQSEILKRPIGVFVTLTNAGQLRGCIGNFDPDIPLYEVIQNMSIAAATQDRRFTPVTSTELPKIDIEISAMTPLKKIERWQDIIIGKHGVKITMDGRSGVLLPQVATENNWDLETFLSTICGQKAGLLLDCYKDPRAQIFTFETEIFSEEEH